MCRVYPFTLSRVSWALAPPYQWRYLMARRNHNHTLTWLNNRALAYIDTITADIWKCVTHHVRSHLWHLYITYNTYRTSGKVIIWLTRKKKKENWKNWENWQKSKIFGETWKKKNMQKRDSNPQPTKTEHFGNVGPNSAGEPVLVSDGLPKATVHLYWPPCACSLPLTSFQVGFGFWRSRVLNGSLGQAVGTSEIVEQHQPSDKYLYQLPTCACTPVQRLSVSFRLSCLRPFSMHAKSRSRALSTVYF